MKKLHWAPLIALALLLSLLASFAQADVIISEVMASNAVFISGRHDDWVELHNDSSAQVSLKGWYLSNDPYDLERWAFPDTAKIAKNGYLVVYCAGSDPVTDGQKGALYASFKLSAKGDEVYLTDPEGNTASVKFGAQYGNVSSGVPAEGEGWHFLETSTPGAANKGLYFDSRAEEPVIETAAGFYDGPVTVTITAPEGLEIRYTTDCATPTRESPLYEEPITVTKTTVVRAAAFADDLLGSTVAGATYFINDPTPIPVPVVSIYTDSDYLFSNKKGILVKGSGGTPNYSRDWEYPIQIEYFDENGVRQISQMGTTRVTGHSSRSGRQKSLGLFARSAFGSDRFEYSFFENRDYTSYSSLLLRCTNSDARSCRMRDAVLMEMSDGLGLFYQAGRPVLVYINGEYYGHYNLREKSNKDALAQWEGITDEEAIKQVNILERTGMAQAHIIRGSNEGWVELVKFCQNNDLNIPENLQYVLDRVDVDSVFNYAIFCLIIGQYDSDNVRMYQFPGGKWKFLLHDIEAGCMNGNEAPADEILRKKASKAGNYPHWILAALLEVPEYRDLFLRRTAEIIQSNFLYKIQVEPIYQKWLDALTPLMPRHIKKFNHFTLKEWNTNVHASMYYARIRPKKTITLLCSHFKLTKSQQAEYFGETLELLAIYNAREN